EITLYSRLMSWAVARTWPSGGRRTTSLRSALLTIYVRLDLPPVIRLALSVPVRRPARSVVIQRPKESKSRPSTPELDGSEPSRSVLIVSVLRSTGHVNDLAVYVAGAAADQEEGGIIYVFGLPDALNRDLLCRV